MKITIIHPSRCQSAYVLVVTLCLIAVATITLVGTMMRASGEAKLNNRNVMYTTCQGAAEAAAEKVVARMAYDFHAFGPGTVTNNLSIYRGYVPSEDSYWTNFTFSDGTKPNAVAVDWVSNYSGAMPSQFPGLSSVVAPIYRIKAYATRKVGNETVKAGIQEDMLLGLVPLPQWAIFANSLLEFSTCATMTVNGRVHANGPIYVGAGSGATLTFNNTVTSTATISAPNNNGQSWGNNWLTTFNGAPPYTTNVPTVNVSINMTNTHSLIELPPAGESPTSTQGQQRLCNLAQVVISVTNTQATITIQNSINGNVPGADPSPTVISNTLTGIVTNAPFLSLTNTFVDQREASKTNLVTQIDVGKYATWISTNSSVLGKFPAGSGTYPTILYVADKRSTTSKQMTSVRLINGTALPVNGGAGFTVATQNPLYVLGNYNCTNAAYLATTNTSATVPAALMSDALTVLSSSWSDSASSGSFTSRKATSTDTVNACILAGVVPSTGTTSTTFSGGIHNLPRLLEDWSSSTLWLNTSILYLYTSQRATNVFVNPGTYYNPPTRRFSYDINFQNPNKQPPGIPVALVAVRVNWGML